MVNCSVQTISFSDNPELVSKPIYNTKLQSVSHFACGILICRQQLGQRSLHRRSRIGRFRVGCCPQRSRRLRLSARIPVGAFTWRWHRFRHGNTSAVEDSRGISRQNHVNILGHSIAKGKHNLHSLSAPRANYNKLCSVCDVHSKPISFRIHAINISAASNNDDEWLRMALRAGDHGSQFGYFHYLFASNGNFAFHLHFA